MSVSVADILALKEQIEMDKKKLEERERALSIVVDMLRERGAVESPQLALIGLVQPDAPEALKSFTQAVKDATGYFKSTEFTVANIETVLKGQGVSLKGKPRARISMILHNLEKDRKVTRVYLGKGNVPHRYRVAAID